MSELLKFYVDQINIKPQSEHWFDQLQAKASVVFAEKGFPSRHQEAWRYLNPAPFFNHSFTRGATHHQLSHEAMISMATGRQTDAPIGKKIALIDGIIMGLEKIQSSLPPGVIVQTLRQAIDEHPDKIRPYLDSIVENEHAFQMMNMALLNDGLFIYVPKNIRVIEPLLLSHWQTTEHNALYIRHVFVVESGGDLTVIEDFQGDANTAYFTDVVTEAHLAERACLSHYKVQRESLDACHVGQLSVRQGATSVLKSHLFSIGAKWSRSDVDIKFDGSEAYAFLNGVYAPKLRQSMGHHTCVHHLVPGCTSEQDYKGIIHDQAQAVFQGRVAVSKGASLTVAKQQNKNLLLSIGAEVDTKPQLDIYADDVQCTHGATVGQLDEDALFYFTARGIDESEAKRYLIQAFASANLQAIEQDALRSWITNLLNQQMR